LLGPVAQFMTKRAGPVGSWLLNWSGLRNFMAQIHSSNLPCIQVSPQHKSQAYRLAKSGDAKTAPGAKFMRGAR